MQRNSKSTCSRSIDNSVAPEQGPVHRETSSATSTIRKFADVAAQAGVHLDTLIAILESGVPLQAVFEIIQCGRKSDS